MKALESSQNFKTVNIRSLINKRCFASYGSLAYINICLLTY